MDINESFEKAYRDLHSESNAEGNDNNPDKISVNHIHIPECLTVKQVESAYSDFTSLRNKTTGFEIEFRFDYDLPVILKGILSDTRFDHSSLENKKINLEKLRNQYSQYFDEWVNYMNPTWFGEGTRAIINANDDNLSFFELSDFYNEEMEIVWQTYENEQVNLGIELEGAPFRAWKEIVKSESIIKYTFDKLSKIMMEIEGNIFEVEKQLGFLGVEIRENQSPSKYLNENKTTLILNGKYDDFTRYFFKKHKGKDENQLMKDEDIEVFIMQNFNANYFGEFKKFNLDCDLNFIYAYAIGLSRFTNSKRGFGLGIVNLLFDNFINFSDHKGTYITKNEKTRFYSNNISSKAKQVNSNSRSFRSENKQIRLK